jgi:ferritin-like metal-binding protein YciE
METTMQSDTLATLFHDTLRDIYYAEHKILKALPKMSAAAQSEDLRDAFDLHLTETEVQIERLEQVFELFGASPEGKTCAAINGILDEGEEIMTTYAGTPVLDAGLVAAAQAVEHYEIARYGTLVSWANTLGMSDAAELLEENLSEESKTDEALTELAEGSINDAALGDDT